ncbi:MAG: hypothetical protein JWO26_2466 [Rhodospirillales bacterium]|jgi:hypothetical protein|nr:hypothetical protein [Rhodospirillales bacterium]MDB5382834.1 hypothetical protein [Rhodospirillales bacterium]
MSSSTLRMSALGLVLLGLTGCLDDPFERPGTWRPAGVQDRNLRAMIADPENLNRGEAAFSDRGAAGSNAATRLLTEQRRPLPASSSLSTNASQQAVADRPLPGLGIASGSGGGASASGGAR